LAGQFLKLIGQFKKKAGHFIESYQPFSAKQRAETFAHAQPNTVKSLEKTGLFQSFINFR